jgi:hypothetical protein
VKPSMAMRPCRWESREGGDSRGQHGCSKPRHMRDTRRGLNNTSFPPTPSSLLGTPGSHNGAHAHYLRIHSGIAVQHQIVDRAETALLQLRSSTLWYLLKTTC